MFTYQTKTGWPESNNFELGPNKNHRSTRANNDNDGHHHHNNKNGFELVIGKGKKNRDGVKHYQQQGCNTI